jgi:hypothetical protein
MPKPREKTTEEIRKEFLCYIKNSVDYWDQIPNLTPKAKLDGVAHSILTMLDGMSNSICGFELIPSTHKDDKAYHKAEGTNWYPQNNKAIDIRENVMLHEEYRRME